MATRQENANEWTVIETMITKEQLIQEIGYFFSSDDEAEFLHFLKEEGYNVDEDDEDSLKDWDWSTYKKE